MGHAGYVEQLANVTIVNSATVRRLIMEPAGEGQIRVAGLPGDVEGVAREWRGDVVIDAGGKNSQAIEQLIEAGAVVGEECEDCGILYYTRHYRLLPGLDEPPRSKAPGTGDLGFIKYGLFPGDNRCFSITLAVPEIEMELRQNVVRPELFDRICALFPGIAPWTDPARSEPISKVFGMGDLKSRWRSLSRRPARHPGLLRRRRQPDPDQSALWPRLFLRRGRGGHPGPGAGRDRRSGRPRTALRRKGREPS